MPGRMHGIEAENLWKAKRWRCRKQGKRYLQMFCTESKFAPSYQLTIAPNRRWTARSVVPRKRNTGAARSDIHVHRHCDGRLASIALLVLLSAQLPETPTVISAGVDRDTADQHGFLWTEGRPVFAIAYQISSERIDGHRQILNQVSILAHGEFDLWRD